MQSAAFILPYALESYGIASYGPLKVALCRLIPMDGPTIVTLASGASAPMEASTAIPSPLVPMSFVLPGERNRHDKAGTFRLTGTKADHGPCLSVVLDRAACL